jgi:hypothetical protein
MKYFIMILLFAVVTLTALTAPVYAYPTVGDGTDSGNCFACHSTRYTEDGQWHTDHQASSGGDCATCHATAEGGGTVLMSVCSDCHDGLPDEWVSDHNDIGIDTCMACHTIENGDDDDGDGATSECPATELLGNNNPQLDTLREFRDEILAKTSGGDCFIKMYYKLGPLFAKACEKNPVLKASAVKMIEICLPPIELLLGKTN